MTPHPRHVCLRGRATLVRLGAGAAILASLSVGADAQAPATAPAAPTQAPAPALQPQRGLLTLTAAFANTSQPIRSGLVWRVYEDKGDGSEPILVHKLTDATPSVPLNPGSYVVHAAYGYASAMKRVSMQWSNAVERLSISAGALKLGGSIADQAIRPQRLSFTIYVPVGNNSEGRLVIQNAKGGELIRLPEGTYHVVSTYGESNAIMRADLRVEAGQVTEAVLNHRAATVTLKLVGAAGGEAVAGTAFSVLTPGGDVIREAIGAFPSVTLAEGDYVLIARHDGQVHTREFRVESGLDRDIEVIAKASQ